MFEKNPSGNNPSETIYRPLTDVGEYPRFAAFPVPASGVGARSKRFEDYVADGDYEPARLWIAERDGDIIARLAFWAMPGTHQPWSADYFDIDAGLHHEERIEVGAALMRAAYDTLVTPGYSMPPHPEGGRPDYHLFLPADWHERADARREADVRIAAAERFGLVRFVERLNLRWTPADGLPPRSQRLRFEPAADRYDELVDVMMRVNTSTLDAHIRRDVGVVPEHRGNHYSDDLVAETLHTISAAGEPMIADSTDVGNAPMAASFARCGYRVTGRRVILV